MTLRRISPPLLGIFLIFLTNASQASAAIFLDPSNNYQPTTAAPQPSQSPTQTSKGSDAPCNGTMLYDDNGQPFCAPPASSGSDTSKPASTNLGTNPGGSTNIGTNPGNTNTNTNKSSSGGAGSQLLNPLSHIS